MVAFSSLLFFFPVLHLTSSRCPSSYPSCVPSLPLSSLLPSRSSPPLLSLPLFLSFMNPSISPLFSSSFPFFTSPSSLFPSSYPSCIPALPPRLLPCPRPHPRHRIRLLVRPRSLRPLPQPGVRPLPWPSIRPFVRPGVLPASLPRPPALHTLAARPTPATSVPSTPAPWPRLRLLRGEGDGAELARRLLALLFVSFLFGLGRSLATALWIPIGSLRPALPFPPPTTPTPPPAQGSRRN